MTAPSVQAFGICDDCGRRVLTGPLADADEHIEIEVPGWLLRSSAVAYALRIAASRPRCRTCLQLKEPLPRLGRCQCVCSTCRSGDHCDRASCAT